MSESPTSPIGQPFESRRRRFQDLMRHRVRHILLVSSLYDSFILSEDGHLNEAIQRQFFDLNLNQNPDLTRVSTGAEALELAQTRGGFETIVTTTQVADMNAVELARQVKERNLDIPVILLGFNNRELTDFVASHDTSPIDRVFLWQGDVRVLMAICKHVEDRLNVAHDTGEMGVPVIIVVEDNIRFYSSFLPVIYTELMAHTRGLISEGLNLSQKMMRTRARPKVLLCSTYEQAWELFSQHEEHVLGVISDIEFPWNGEMNRCAGVELTKRMREVRFDIPIVLQSSNPANKKLAKSIEASFLLKGSPVLLHDLRRILLEHFGFGDFVFRLPDGEEVARVTDLRELIENLKTVPAESIGHHGERNHFSNWLKARTEFALAERLRPRRVEEFETLEHLRRDMIRSISEYRRQRDTVIVADFDRSQFDTEISISRIGGGSLGGKARGLAFVNRLLNDFAVNERFPQIRIAVPYSVVLGTDLFDQFIEQNGLRDPAYGAQADEDVDRIFQGATFPEEARRDLEVFLRTTNHPLAVRSSGLLEDSPYQPFAGIYQTYMVPNIDPDPAVRLEQLIRAVKRVYASTFSQVAKGFLDMTHFRLEEEKMAVIIQRVIGARHGTRFYPSFSGVARSYNFYPTAPVRAEDGVMALALGLGKTVVDGGACLRVCPKYPRHLVAFSSVEDVLRNSQREFYALDLSDSKPDAADDATLKIELGEGVELTRYGLRVAEKDGTLAAVGSTYSPDNDAVYDGTSRPGVRLVSFAPILKYEILPLAPLIRALLEIGEQGTSSPVEIEFAVNLSGSRGELPEFGFLQMRPLALTTEAEELEIGDVLSSELVCRSSNVLGNGRIADLTDLVVVDYHRFDRKKSTVVAGEVAKFNAELQARGAPYVLIGVGRWGSTDPYLGIPVSWNQIAGARVIVESGFRDFKVTPSQGTHFFQNLTSCDVGYFTVNPEAGEGFVDWDWLSSQPVVEQTEYVRHVRLASPLTVKMNGKTGEGVILKPEETR